MPARRCWRPPPGSWRNGACEANQPGVPADSDFGAAVITATAVLTTAATGAASAGAARFEDVGGGTATTVSTAAAVAAVFPALGTGAPIATATASVATASVAAATAVATTTTRGATTTTATTAGLGLVDAQGTAHQLSTLEGIDRAGLGVGVGHLDEGEAALAAGVALQRQRAVDHVSERSEQLSHVLLLSAEGKIADENTH